MIKRLLPFAVALVALAVFLAAKVQATMPRLVGVPGAQNRMVVAGKGRPTIVLDTFGAMASEMWGTIQWRCSEFGRVVTYDHLSTGGSDPGPKPRDARHIATELHDLLKAANLPPPYVLVGYSFGGPYTRVFIDLYPDKVIGLVLIDPSPEEMFDWLKKKRPDVNRTSGKDEAEQNELACTYRSLDQARAARLPTCPLTLITAMRPFGEMDPRLRPRWLAAHQNWLAKIPGAKHIVTERSDHGIVWEDPDLVVSTIREMVTQIRR